MGHKTWDEMSDAEKAEINRQEDEKESYKANFAGSDISLEDGLSDEPSDEDLAEWYARMEEQLNGHKDSIYW